MFGQEKGYVGDVVEEFFVSDYWGIWVVFSIGGFGDDEKEEMEQEQELENLFVVFVYFEKVLKVFLGVGGIKVCFFELNVIFGEEEVVQRREVFELFKIFFFDVIIKIFVVVRF